MSALELDRNMRNRAIVVLLLFFTLLCNSCIFGAYTTAHDMANDIRQGIVSDLRIQIDGLEGEIRVLQLRQSYLEEIILMMLAPPEHQPWDPEDREEEVDHAV